MKNYNGHANYNAWNVSLWINNDEGLYHIALDCIEQTGTAKEAAQLFMDILHEVNITHTGDRVRYTKTNVYRAIVGIKRG